MNNYSQSRTSKIQRMDDVRNQVNDLLNSVCNMQLQSIQKEILKSSKIVGEILHNDIIAHARSMPSLKLIIYELIFKLAERTQYPLTQISGSNAYLEGQYASRIEIYDKSILKILQQILGLIVELTWTQPQLSKVKPKTEKCMGNYKDPGQKLHYYHQQLQNLVRQYEQKLRQQQNSVNCFDEQGHDALIEQLQDVVTKKEQKIQQLVKQLDEVNVDFKNMHKMIKKLQIEKNAIQEENLILKEQIERYSKETQLRQTKSTSAQLNLKRKHIEEPIIDKNQRHSIFSRSSEDNKQENLLENNNFFQKITQENINSQNLERFLFAQAISLEALLTYSSQSK